MEIELDLKNIDSEENRNILSMLSKDLLITIIIMCIGRIDKAIEYIKAGKTFDNEDTSKVVEHLQNNLLNILKGDNNE